MVHASYDEIIEMLKVHHIIPNGGDSLKVGQI